MHVWDSLTTVDVAAVDRARAIALLPVAATEQHGPHLPLATDWMIADAIVDAAAGYPLAAPVFRLPTQRIGVSGEHDSFPGTLSIDPDTAIGLWTALGISVRRAGIRKLIVFNTHGGQQAIVDLVAQKLRCRAGMLVVRASSFGLGLPPDAVDERERRYGLHGGRTETAIMLHIARALVQWTRVASFRSAAEDLETGFSVLEVEGATGIGWLAEDLNPAGVTGDAASATAELGARILAHYGQRLAALINDTARVPLPDRALGDG